MSSGNASILSSPIEYLKGIGPLRADMLKKELEIFTFGDLLNHFPNRHIDKTRLNTIREISPQTDYIQVAGTLLSYETVGAGRAKRLVAQLKDKTGILELAWFQGINWVVKNLHIGSDYLVFGKTGFFNGKPQIVHPEIEPLVLSKPGVKNFLEPVYPSTEKLKARGFNGRQLGKCTEALFSLLKPGDLPENLPDELVQQLGLLSRYDAYRQAHFPQSPEWVEKAFRRLKFE
jgi:ATP-dependent DNA helicase RecG